MVVKFCERGRYFAGAAGAAVQELWALHGLAPKIHRAVRLPGGRDMVVMEYLSPEDGWRGLNLKHYNPGEDEGPAAWYAREAAVRVGLRKAHSLRLPWPLGAEGLSAVPTLHGDIRLPNVLLRRTRSGPRLPWGTGGVPSELAYEVRFIDFDWAGLELPTGVAGGGGCRCPLVINRDLFPPVVVPGERLTQETDGATLEFSLALDEAHLDES